MKIFIITILYLFTFDSWAKIFTNQICQQKVENILKKWDSQNNWTYKESNFYIASTTELGKWIWYKDEGDSITITRATQFEQVRINYNKSTCIEQMMVVPIAEKQTHNYETDDEMLKQEIKENSGLIYIWSPQMPLSYKGIFQIKKIAQKKNLKLIVLLASNARIVGKKNFKNEYLKRENSFELKMRNVHMHYPAVLAFKNGSMVDKIKYGYENEMGYENDIKNIFKL